MVMGDQILYFHQVNRTHLGVVGGKGANLGELVQAGFDVPEGFCVTTKAYQSFIATSNQMDQLLEQLNSLEPGELDHIRELGKRIRSHLLELSIPTKLQNEIVQAWEAVGTHYGYAVRSSATAEDLPHASFAGQQDTYLNIKGKEQLLNHIRKCWASLFTDRAIAYRAKNGFDHRHVYLSVVVQRMIYPEISGILFTADPVNGNRRVISIDASFGLGEAIVSGLVSADLYKVKDGQIIEQNISNKKVAILSLPEGGTTQQELPLEKQTQQVLTEEQILSLAEMGKKVERHFGYPQDIEFCIENGAIYLVQSRPITSIYPIPELPDDSLQVMISFGYVQMMTDAMKPLGLSVLQTIFPKSFLLEAGGRLFVNPTMLLRTKIGSRVFPKVIQNVMEEALGNALVEVIQRPEFKQVPPEKGFYKSARRFALPIANEVRKNLFQRDPKLFKQRVETVLEARLDEFRKDLQNAYGAKRFETIQRHLKNIPKKVLFQIFPVIACFPLSHFLLKILLNRWLGNDEELHLLNKSLPGNLTSEMGLEIGDLADLLREYPEVEVYLKQAEDATFYEGLNDLHGGDEFKKAFEVFMERFGHRCPGEIDLTRTRWRESPTQLVPAMLGHMRSVQPKEHRERFLQGEKEAEEAAKRIMEQLQGNPLKVRLAKRLMDVYRQVGGLREHPKYYLILFLDACKKAILKEAETMVHQGYLKQLEDAFYLTLDELIQLSKGEFQQDVQQLIFSRKEQFQWHQALKPPKVMTSEGEMITGNVQRRDVPPGALVGNPVSAGVAEGRARVVFKPEEAQLHEGDILVAPHTDPGWTALFQSAKALVTEVGGLMTHGAVVAREYGIPAVVGIEEATQKIKDGQRIRVDGNRGLVEILKEDTE